MKILYAVQGTGNGHIGRARVMAAAFKSQNIQVDWMFSGRADSSYFNMEIFGDYKTYNGLTFIIKNNKMDLLSTLKAANIFKFYQETKSLNLENYDLLINDFEPVSAWAAKSHSIKSIGLSHQSAFLYDIPYTRRNPLFNFIMKHYAPVKLAIGIHWKQFDKHIIPPIIAPVLHEVENNSNQIVVYLPFYSTEKIVKTFQNFKDYEFHIFQKNPPTANYENLKFHPFSRDEFAKYSAKCNGIISNAGFELPSEALQIGKKMLLEPIQGQFEQISNANMLKNYKWSEVQNKLDSNNIKQWLEQEGAAQITWPNVAEELVKWIKSDDKNSIAQLSDNLWRQIKT